MNEAEGRLTGNAIRRRIVGRSPQILDAVDVALRAAAYDYPVLITGESGTGKELFARLIHWRSARRMERPFIAVNCAALPQELAESELFGHVKGAFTGAHDKHDGYFISANRGSIFLDEVGDMPPRAQTKLLRVLQDGHVTRVGSVHPVCTNVRIIAATNRPVSCLREDLYHRLAVIELRLPPLRERKEDIAEIAERIIQNEAGARPLSWSLSSDVVDGLLQYDWPGNVRELENHIKRAIVTDKAPAPPVPVSAEEVVADAINEDNRPMKAVIRDIENHLIVKALASNGGVINRAAKQLGLNRTTLIEAMKTRGITREMGKAAA